MVVIYFSKTGNIEKFMQKISINQQKIKGEADLISSESFILVVYTTLFGEIPPEVSQFLTNNSKNLVGVIGSGNKNWGPTYCLAAKNIAEQYQVPNLLNFELSGNTHDIQKFNEIMSNLKLNKKENNGE